MTKLALAALLLVACGKPDEDYKKQKPPEEEKPAEPAVRTPPPPPKKELKPEEMGKCELHATGAVKADQTSMGGRPATNISYWFTDEEKKNMMGVDGFVVNCHGPDIKFSILPGGGKIDGMPFGPKKYTFTKGKGDANVMVTFAAKPGSKNAAAAPTMDGPNGTVDITAFDKHHIAGTIDLSGKIVPGNGAEKLTGTFDLVCPGFSGCE